MKHEHRWTQWANNPGFYTCGDKECARVLPPEQAEAILNKHDELLDALETLFNLLEDNQDDAPWYLRKHYSKAEDAIRP